ncbi:MAG: ABC transporter ATP-binding protein [Microgenomates group bacterium]
MSKTIIKVENLGKKYRIGEKQSYYSLRDTIGNIFNGKKKPVDEFWALNDISFEVKQGESVGIIGRNGAGKSTLLKILSRITPPTTGKITLEGRVASLLEVGTGFNPELTGRENIFLNGAILGMKQWEIKKKFDEIVAFSEVEKFLDMPVKHYSSGMYMRLAFAVAAHLESEILVVDEVLAVGDAQFQKKCLGKMGEVTSKEGRTVLFVSHNLGAVVQLCSKAILLSQGKVLNVGSVPKVIEDYQNYTQVLFSGLLADREDRVGEGKIRLLDFEVRNNLGDKVETVFSGERVTLIFKYKCRLPVQNIGLAVSIFREDGQFLSIISNEYTSKTFASVNKNGVIRCEVERWPFMAGRYYLNFDVTADSVSQDWIKNAAVVITEDGDYYNSGNYPPPSHRGFFFPNRWFVGPN